MCTLFTYYCLSKFWNIKNTITKPLLMKNKSTFFVSFKWWYGAINVSCWIKCWSFCVSFLDSILHVVSSCIHHILCITNQFLMFINIFLFIFLILFLFAQAQLHCAICFFAMSHVYFPPSFILFGFGWWIKFFLFST